MDRTPLQHQNTSFRFFTYFSSSFGIGYCTCLNCDVIQSIVLQPFSELKNNSRAKWQWTAFPPGGGASCHHLTPLLSSGRPELEPRASKKINNSREDREFLSLEMTKRKKDKDIPLLEGQRSLVGFFSEYWRSFPRHRRCLLQDNTCAIWTRWAGGVLVEHSGELRAPEPRSGETEAPW